MRRVTCHFETRTSFLDHCDIDGEFPGISFIAQSGLSDGELVRLVLTVAEADERHTLHMRITGRRPTLEGPDGGIHWRYRATATRSDVPWLKMLYNKCDTARRLNPTDGAA